MAKYILKRLVAAAITLFIILTLSFMVVRLMPGSVYDDPNLPAEVVAVLEERAHLDEPIPIQYLYFLKGVFIHLDHTHIFQIEILLLFVRLFMCQRRK